MFILFVVILFPILFLILLQQYLNRDANYWKERGVISLENGTQISSFFNVWKHAKTPVDADNDLYKALGDEKYGGRFEFGTPMLFVKDLDIIKQLLVKDFGHFMNRRDFIDTDPLLSKALFFLRGSEWKEVRTFLSPTFTSGKIRRMFHHFERCSHSLKQYILKNSPKCSSSGSGENGYEVNVYDDTRRFAVDVIGAAAFGMETDALKEKDSHFFAQCKKTSISIPSRLLKFVVFSFYPRLANFFKAQFLEAPLTEYMVGLLRTSILTRESNSSEGRDDFLQLLIEAKAEDKTNFEFTTDLAVSQAFSFLNAGFDAVAGTIATLTYILSVHQDIQEKLRDEVLGALINEKVTYEAVNKMEFLDMVVSEMLRMYSPAQRLERKCAEEYEMPGANFKIPKGMMVVIPIDSIHYDEKYYPNPHQFIPERFSAENKAARNPYTYLPFGTGPRNCIGMRFALVETKVAICHLLLNFHLRPIPGVTPVPIRMWKKFGFTRIHDDLKLEFIPRTGN